MKGNNIGANIVESQKGDNSTKQVLSQGRQIEKQIEKKFSQKGRFVARDDRNKNRSKYGWTHTPQQYLLLEAME